MLQDCLMPAVRTARFCLPDALVQQRGDPGSVSYEKSRDVGHTTIVFIGERWL
jgi:hypothetical protein